MPVRVTEIEALPAARLRGAALDRDASLAETLLPSCEVGGVDREGDVERPMAVVRRNGAAGQPHGLKRRAALKHQQHAASAHVVGAKARVACERSETENVFVEAGSAL